MVYKPDLHPDTALRQAHALEHHAAWEYKRTWVYERDHPNGWAGRETPPDGAGWERNVDTEEQGFEVREGASGRMLLTHWRRPR